MKQAISTIILSLLISSMAYAGSLQNDLDRLNPEASEKIIKTPLAKSLSPLPESLIQDMGFGISRGIHSFKETNISHLNTNHNINTKTAYWGTQKFISFKWDDKTRIGMVFYGADMHMVVNDADDATRVSINDSSFSITQLYVSRTIYEEMNMKIGVFGGIGEAKFKHTLLNINTPGSTNTTPASADAFRGDSWSYQAGLNASYMLNPVWEIGLAVSYLSANIEELKNSQSQVLTNANISLSGTMFYIYTGRTIF